MRQSSFLSTLGILFIIFGISLPFVTYVATYFLPRKYTSVVTIEVKSNQKLISVGGPGGNGEVVDPHFVADQIQGFLSTRILYPVIDELDLVNKWSAGLPAKITKDQAYTQLVKMTKVRQVQNTDMVTIAVTSTDRLEAADIANTIVAIYMKNRKEDLATAVNNALQELQVEVDKQTEKVKALRDQLEKIRARDNITDPNPDTMDKGPQTFSDEYLKAKQDYINAKALLEAAMKKYESEKMNLMITLVPAKVWDSAEPAAKPSSPNVAFFLAISLGAGIFFIVCGVVLCLVGSRREQGS